MKKTFDIKSDLKAIGPVVNEILSSLKKHNVRSELLHDIKLAMEEAIINAIKHGNKFRQELPVTISLEIASSPLLAFARKQGGLAMTVKNKVVISVEDQGEGYDYRKVPDPTLDENIPKGHGRGVFLIRRLMDEVHFNDRGNRIEMVKYIR